ncbi:2-iminobutanoate/2-iminopropanoate deaminase-like [Dysidea avara]|uniref:2-iminobutanoate/2-iminopropanoate deaminase-like n=1 Tax=Dysidea avara TaxID=196820 RepID=UPI00331C85DB
MAGAVKKIINTAFAPKPIGPYNQAVAVGNTVYVSGQIGIVPKTMELVSANVQDQTRQTLDNMKQVLEAANSSFESVVKVTVFLADINDYPTVNEVYSQYFTKDFPSRSAVQVAALPKAARVEIEAIAVMNS